MGLFVGVEVISVGFFVGEAEVVGRSVGRGPGAGVAGEEEQLKMLAKHLRSPGQEVPGGAVRGGEAQSYCLVVG